MTVAEIVRAGLGSRFTAAVVRVERGGRAVYEEAAGGLDDESGAKQVTPLTRFDVASLTKVFVATAALFAVADGALAIDEPLLGLLPEWRERAHRPITLRMLLAHTSGMHSGADYRTLFGESVERYALERELDAAPGEQVIYSDLGFIALGVVLERALGLGLPAAIASANRRLGIEGASFRPPPSERSAIPATECDAWRGRVRGIVHDEKAYLMNGIAGHAGLFGTARDVAAVAEAFLAPASSRGSSALPAEVATAAIAQWGEDPVLRRGLGWALKTNDENSCGVAMTRDTFGHTGFTGTCVWADPARDLSVTFLTNGVYFGRHDLRELRAAVCDAALAEWGG